MLKMKFDHNWLTDNRDKLFENVNKPMDNRSLLYLYSRTCVRLLLLKRLKISFQDQLSLNAGQKYCRMLQREHSAILSTFIKPPFVIKIFVLSIFEWPFYTGFTVCYLTLWLQ